MNLDIGKTTLGLPVADLAKGYSHMNMKKMTPRHLNIDDLMSKKFTGVNLGETQGYPESHIMIDSIERKDFMSILTDMFHEASRTQNEVDLLTQRAIVDPDSVDVHEVTIAMAKANMTLSISKAVLDRSINGFKDILNQR